MIFLAPQLIAQQRTAMIHLAHRRLHAAVERVKGRGKMLLRGVRDSGSHLTGLFDARRTLSSFLTS